MRIINWGQGRTNNGPVRQKTVTRRSKPEGNPKPEGRICGGFKRQAIQPFVLLCSFFILVPILAAEPPASRGLEFVRVGKDGRHFVLSTSGTEFDPWGFNYDRDISGRLLETYWLREWDAVERHFQEMKKLGANTVRIHLQVSRFMKSAMKPNRESLRRLARLVSLAEKTRLYLDITGLGCYDKKDVPSWYNGLDEQDRWDVQARFWEAVARTCSQSPAVFCYDLMNEPVLSEDKQYQDWTPGAFGDRYYVQRLTLDFAGRTPQAIAKAWRNKMLGAIRRHDTRHLVTVGTIPETIGSRQDAQAWNGGLDFVSVHFYPKTNEVDKSLALLSNYDIGKPIVIEEMFPLYCPIGDLGKFIDGSRVLATGWLGFYWGKPIEEYRRDKALGKGTIGDTWALDWLEYFAEKSGNITTPRRGTDAGPHGKH
jgi:hypothetical protein